MKLVNIRIKSYRSIADEISLTLGNRTTIIGPNNSGKTNITHAIQGFFSGLDYNLYDVDRDLPANGKGGQTSMVATFQPDALVDAEFMEIYSEVQNCFEEVERQALNFQLFLYFSKNGKPVYQFFPNKKIKHKQSQKLSSLHGNAVRKLLSLFSCKYIPSVKDPNVLFATLLLPFIRKSVAAVLDPHIADIRNQLNGISNALNASLQVGKLGNVIASFDIDGSIENTLSSFDFQIDDGIKMSARSKGAGLQAAAILASLKWIGLEEQKSGRETIWLLEEPESYLHPNLAKSCKYIIEDLSQLNTVVVTTHAISFVGSDPAQIYETNASTNGTVLKQCQTYSEATASIRKALGLRYSDFFQLGTANIFVEGVSDREIITWALDQIKPHRGKNLFPVLRSATIMDFTGVTSIKEFLKHSYNFIRDEVAVFVVFDGDEAGVSSSSALNGYFSKKNIPFNANRDYAVLPNKFSIEGLFPSNFIVDLHNVHPGWFQVFNADIHGVVRDFSIKDGSKSSAQKALMLRAESESKKTGNYVWAKEFISLFNLAEEQLSRKLEALL